MSSSTMKKTVQYCPVCSFPFEYCEYGGFPSLCKRTLLEKDPLLYEKIYGSPTNEDIQDKGSISSITDDVEHIDVNSDKDSLNREKAAKKEEQRLEKERKRLESLRIRIKLVNKVGNKHATHIKGLSDLGLDLKKVARSCAQKFACGCSVVKNAANEEEVVVQGDFVCEIKDFLIASYSGVLSDNNVLVAEEKKKK